MFNYLLEETNGAMIPNSHYPIILLPLFQVKVPFFKLVYNLTHLEILDLSSNKISNLDAGLSKLIKLKMLDVSNNSISKLDSFL